MSCQSYHCAQGRQPCPTPDTCRDACATLRTANSDHSSAGKTGLPITLEGPEPEDTAKAHKRRRTDAISLFFLRWACLLAGLVALGTLAGYLSAKLA